MDPSGIMSLDERSKQIFRQIVETYLETGEPVGSRTLSRGERIDLSPASIRNVMQDLEALGLITAPHISAGRVPTQFGLRLFVDALLEVGNIDEVDRAAIEQQAATKNIKLEDALSRAGEMLSGLSQCAGIVLATKVASKIRHIDFVMLDNLRALVVLVDTDGTVENRLMELPVGMTPSALAQAANYINHQMRGLSLVDASERAQSELANKRAEIDQLAASVVEAGLAVWNDGDQSGDKLLVVRGTSHLIADAAGAGNLERLRLLFDDFEHKENLMQLLGLTEKADGVRIFIGSENNLFSLSNSSLVVAPYHDAKQNVVGVLGVIGPTRINYARIVPMVDYTAQMMQRILG
jgi:heat-inducible transcriptional repressor